jgi:hypothetical protein
MTQEEMRATIEASARDAVFFTRVYPPQHESNPTSFFGGLPRLPRDLDWPVQQIAVDYGRTDPEPAPSLITAPVALTFLGQVDRGDLPRTSDLELLPKQGILYFFFASATFELDLPREPGTGGEVLYWPGGSGDLSARSEPSLLRPIYGSDAEYHYEWLKHTHTEAYPFPRSSPKWAVKPTVVKTYGANTPFADAYRTDRAAHEAFWALKTEMTNAELTRAFGEPIERNYFVWEQAPRGKWRGGPGFPYAWICIEIFAGLLIYEFRKQLGREIEGALRAGIKAAESQAWHWLDRSREQGRFRPVGDNARAEFWAWYEQMIAHSDSKSNIDPRD